jgi:hypothetical protein
MASRTSPLSFGLADLSLGSCRSFTLMEGGDVMLVKAACQDSYASWDNRGMIATRTPNRLAVGDILFAMGADLELLLLWAKISS